jgi:transposase
VQGLAQLVDGLRAGRHELPADATVAATALAEQRAALDAAADALERRITAQAKADRKAVMLKTAPGVGPLSAHATLATMADPSLFRSGRDFAAWLGLTPRLHGTGGKTHTGRITKQGNQPLRRLLVLGATAWLRHVKARPEKGSPWLRALLARRPIKVVAVAQAARTARILWAMLTHNQPYRAPAIG